MTRYNIIDGQLGDYYLEGATLDEAKSDAADREGYMPMLIDITDGLAFFDYELERDNTKNGEE